MPGRWGGDGDGGAAVAGAGDADRAGEADGDRLGRRRTGRVTPWAGGAGNPAARTTADAATAATSRRYPPNRPPRR